MILIIDRGSPPENLEAVLHALPSDLSRQTLTPEQIPNLGKEDRVILLANLSTGGYEYQQRFLTRNTEVVEWLIYSPELEPDSLNHLTASLRLTENFQFFRELPDLLCKMETPPKQHNTCLLLCTGQDSAPVDALRTLLEQFLPDWHFFTDMLSPEHTLESMLNESTCARSILIGTSYASFCGLSWPSQMQPLIALVWNQPEPDALLPSEDICREIQRWLAPGCLLQNKETVFSVMPLYETWRRQLKEEALSASSLTKDNRLVVWDSFGLPICLQEYSPDRITSFLNCFNGGEALSAAL